MRIVLASTSPRRREILSLLGVPFDVLRPEFEEVSSTELSPEEEAREFSVGKARSLPEQEGSIVIGSDTLIALDGEKIGKPLDRGDAVRMLRKLSGRRHEILTGIAVTGPEAHRAFTDVERVQVQMRPYSREEIIAYLDTGESLDKAGAYSIQDRGSHLIAGIRGDYLAAVGLPLRTIANYLQRLGFRPPVDVDELYQRKGFRNWKSMPLLV